MKRKTSQISLRLGPELFDAIDRARGQVPRERWVRELVIAAVALPDVPEPAKFSDISSLGPIRPAIPHRDFAALAPGQAHLSTCRCPVCRPPKGGKS